MDFIADGFSFLIPIKQSLIVQKFIVYWDKLH